MVVSFLKKYWFIIALSFIAIFLFAVWLMGQVPQVVKTPIPTTTPSVNPSSNNTQALPIVSFPTQGSGKIPDNTFFKISTNNLQLPENVNLYSIQTKGLTLDQAKNIATKLGFPSEPIDSTTNSNFQTTYSWQRPNSYLSITLSPMGISLSSENNNSKISLSQQEAIDSLKSILNQLGLPLPEETTISANNQANLNKINLLIENTPIVSSLPEQTAISFSLDNTRQLVFFGDNIGFSSYEKTAVYPTKTKQEIEKSFLTEGRIVQLGTGSEFGISVQPSSINITSAKIVFLFSQNQLTYLYPYYLLKGEAQTNLGVLPIIVAIPAIKSSYLEISTF